MKTVIVSGATGHQGGALLDVLTLEAYTVIALTRSPAKLKGRSAVHPVQCDLDDPGSVEAAFVEAQKVAPEGRIDAVVCVLAFPGLGVDDSGEVRQGQVSSPRPNPPPVTSADADPSDAH